MIQIDASTGREGVSTAVVRVVATRTRAGEHNNPYFDAANGDIKNAERDNKNAKGDNKNATIENQQGQGRRAHRHRGRVPPPAAPQACM